MTGTFDSLLNPIDPGKVEALRDVVAVSRDLNIPFMLFGAFARDIHFFHAHNLELTRGTTDVDISIQVPNWEAYERFRRALCEGNWEPREDKHPEKLYRKGANQELDLLPFGDIAEDGHVIWPVDNSPWSVIGFDEAFAATVILPLEGDAQVPVVSLPSLVALKLVALHDRPEARSKRDGTDVAFVVAKYLDVGHRDRLREGNDSDIMSMVESDLDLASAMLMGRDMARQMRNETRKKVLQLLEEETTSRSRCYLVRGMIGRHFDDFARAREVVSAMLAGIQQFPEN